jgi:AraC-like DNA-binding protein
VIRLSLGNLRASPLYRLVTDHITNLARAPATIAADPAAGAVATASIDLSRALLASAAGHDRLARQALAETLLSRIRAHVRRHLTDPDLSAAGIAAAHNISLRQLYKVCAGADLSLEQWIITERLQGARHELALPDRQHLSVAAIARRWGFRDPTHFTRRFKARYGTSPSQWRRFSAEARPAR